MALRSCLLLALLGGCSPLILGGCVNTTSSGNNATTESRWARPVASVAPGDDDAAEVEGTGGDGENLAESLFPTVEEFRQPAADEPIEYHPLRQPTDASNGDQSIDEPKLKRRWFPWGREKRKEEAARAEEEREKREELGPRISDPMTRKFVGDEIPTHNGLSQADLGRWGRDPRKTMESARDERNMVLLWMDNSQTSGGLSQMMVIELFRHPRFLELAKDDLELTRIDYGEHAVRSHPYARRLKENLSVNGYPTLILFSPEGDELWRHAGYRRGRFGLVLGELQRRADIFVLNEQRRRKRLDEAGFRTWTNDDRKPLYAKAVGVSRDTKTVTLRLPTGEEHQYSVLKLSETDREWLAASFLEVKEAEAPAEGGP